MGNGAMKVVGDVEDVCSQDVVGYAYERECDSLFYT